MPSFLKLAIEIGPLLLFFIAYKYSGLIAATTVVVISTLIAQAITYYYEKKVSPVQLATTILLVIFGSITIYSGNSMFIKLKPTIINILFASILFIGIYRKTGLLKHIFNNTLKMSDQNWIIFSKRWGFFFLFMAILNEVIWRNVSENIWVNFKVFGILGLTIIFLFSQLPFLNKNSIKE